MPDVAWDDGQKKGAKSITMPLWLIERLTWCAAFLRDHPETGAPGNLSHLICEGAFHELVRWEDELNGGRPFDPVDGLPTGPGRGAMRGAAIQRGRTPRQ